MYSVEIEQNRICVTCKCRGHLKTVEPGPVEDPVSDEPDNYCLINHRLFLFLHLYDVH